jgi:hypothetical protein
LRRPQSFRKLLEIEGLEAFQSEPNQTLFGTGKQMQEKGRK